MRKAVTSVAASLVWLLTGDAPQRALAAWSLGWPEARQASGETWQAPFLATLLTDPYATVRQVAYKSLRQLPGYENFTFDFVGLRQARSAARTEAYARWSQGDLTPDRTGPRILIDPPGRLREDAVERLLKQRDDRRVRIAE